MKFFRMIILRVPVKPELNYCNHGSIELLQNIHSKSESLLRMSREFWRNWIGQFGHTRLSLRKSQTKRYISYSMCFITAFC